MFIKAFCDGGGPNTQGSIACGVYILDEYDKEITRFNKHLGKGTNNIAEYNAAIEGVKWLLNNGYETKKCKVYMDSKLIVMQYNRKWQCKKTHLQDLLKQLRLLTGKFTSFVEFEWLPRESNAVADEEATKALDGV